MSRAWASRSASIRPATAASASRSAAASTPTPTPTSTTSWRRCLPRACRSLVLDLAELDYISSAGIRSIFKARKALAARGGKVAGGQSAAADPEGVRRGQGGADERDLLSASEADAYLDAMQRKVLRGDEDEENY